MKPHVESRLGFDNKIIRNRGCRRIAKRCDGWKSVYAGVRSDLALIKVSQRDARTEPGVLTPGTDQNNDPPQRGGRAVRRPGKQVSTSRHLQNFFCRPFRAVPKTHAYPGLKPRAESCYPFGISSVNFQNAGFSLIEMLVVVTIIAAIAALITTSVMSALQQQNARVCQNNMLTIEAAKDEYIRDHPGATNIDETAFAQYFRFGIPKCPDGGTYDNLYVLTKPVSCSRHGALQAFPSATP